MKRPRWFVWLVLHVFAVLLVTTTGFVAYRVYKAERKARQEQQERALLASLSLDNLRWNISGFSNVSDQIAVTLYNPKMEGFAGRVDWHVHVYDPSLRTHFDRIFRGYLRIGPHQFTTAYVPVEFAFGTICKPSARIEWVQR